jgi:putative FmdB family regulatory protein
MPIYEYRCKDCGTHLERRQKVSDEPLKVCEDCGGTLEKQWSRTGFQFKGEGWYVTDYAGKKDKSKSESEKSGSTESTTSSDTASKPKSETASKSDPSKK